MGLQETEARGRDMTESTSPVGSGVVALGKTDRNCTHLAGEYFVAAELSKRGYAVAITMGNAKAIDLFAEKGGRSVSVQVKAIAVRKNVGWPMMKDRVTPNVLYVLVCLNGCGSAPTYFLLTSEEAKAKVNQYRTRG